MRLAMRAREMTDILSPEMMSSEVKGSSVSRCQDVKKVISGKVIALLTLLMPPLLCDLAHTADRVCGSNIPHTNIIIIICTNM